MASSAGPEDLAVAVEDQKVDHAMERDQEGTQWLRFVARLSPADYTVIILHTRVMCNQQRFFRVPRRVGVAVGDIVLDPLL